MSRPPTAPPPAAPSDDEGRPAPFIHAPAPRLLLPWLAVTVVACALSILYLDRPVALWIGGWPAPARRAAEMVSEIANGWLVLGVAVTGFVLFRFVVPRRAAMIGFGFVLVSYFVGWTAKYVLKILLGRARPELLVRDEIFEFGFLKWEVLWRAFPSGHAVNAMIVALCLTTMVPRYGALWLALGGLVAAARVAALQHYPSDVIAGAYLALLTVVFVARLFRASGAISYPARSR